MFASRPLEKRKAVDLVDLVDIGRPVRQHGDIIIIESQVPTNQPIKVII